MSAADTREVEQDEPTSRMDPRGEHQIFEQIKAIAADRITVVIAHRLENTRIGDHIVVMEHGRITEQGRYDGLVRADSTFAELLELSQDRCSLPPCPVPGTAKEEPYSRPSPLPMAAYPVPFPCPLRAPARAPHVRETRREHRK